MNITKKQKIIGICVALFILLILLIIFLTKSKNNPDVTPGDCQWVAGGWDKCNNNSQSRTVTCQSNNTGPCKNPCTGDKPASTQACTIKCCNTTSYTCNPLTGTDCPSGTTPVDDCTIQCSSNNPPDPAPTQSSIYIFSPGDDTNTQKIINKCFISQGGYSPKDNNGQNSKFNFAFLFMPGNYDVVIPIGYYTHVAGLGKTNNDVTIKHGPVVNNGSRLNRVGALNNFWRTCENMTINPSTNISGVDTPRMIYAVSQASSLRSITINGDLQMSDTEPGPPDGDGGMGFSSGGFIGNSKITGILGMGSQQQFICRNTEYGSFPVALWNQVNVGCISQDPADVDSSGKKIIQGCCINTPTPLNKTTNLTVVEKTPYICEKPYLAVSDNNDKNSIIVIVPSPNKPLENTQGVNKFDSTTAKIISKPNYYLVTDSTITGQMLNQIFAEPSFECVILGPGRYNIETPINLNGKLLFGLGVPVLRSTNNNNIIIGYGKMCGIIFEAGPTSENTNILVKLSNGNPSYLWDISCRVGGDPKDATYSIDKMLYIGGDNSILDNVWCWVADHYSDNSPTSWDNAVCNTGVYVDAKNVIAYGLFSEHNRVNNVVWNGDNGQVYMFQSEFNYYPPKQSDFNNSVSYYVKDSVTSHTIKGAGAYSYFPVDNNVMATSGFSFPTGSGIIYENLITVFLNGYGGITNIFNQTGPTVKYSSSGAIIDHGKTYPQTQIAVYCNKKDSCRCPECTEGTCDPVKTLGRCKPPNACTDDQMKTRNEAGKLCSDFVWICATNQTGCNGDGDKGKTSALTDCGGDESNICQWW